VQMSRFVVQTTQGLGYVDANAATALKANQRLLDIPQGVFVMTNDLIRDIGATDLSDVLLYAGVNGHFRGETNMIRGSRTSYPYIDDMLDNVPYEDNIYVDSIEVVKGPSAVFYPNASLGGVILKMTKKPLQRQQDIVTLSSDQYGLMRATFDSTGPMGKVGDDIKLSYRVEGAYQGGNCYFKNEKLDVMAIHPTLQMDYKQTTAIIAWDFQKLLHPPSGAGFLTPYGTLYTGRGREYEGGWVPNQMEHMERRGARAILIQRFSTDWEMKFAAQIWTFQRYGGIAGGSATNWATNTASYITRQNNEYYNVGCVQDDFHGKFMTGIFEHQSAFGFNHTDVSDISKFWTTTAPGYTQSFSIPIDSTAALNAVVVPQQDSGGYVVPANPGSRAKTYRDNIYYQHQLDIIPNRLSLVAGFTFADIESVNDLNLALNAPYGTQPILPVATTTPAATATDLPGSAWLHRLGVVLHVTKDISLYGLEATIFTPGTGVDYSNNRLPNVTGKGDEVGFKTALWDGRLTSTISAFKQQLTNQAIIGVGLNPFGLGYYIPIGSTTTRGWDSNVALALVPGWQVILTTYRGTVRDQAGNPVSATYGDSWSLFTRYDFARDTALKGLTIGGGASRMGNRFMTTSGMTFPTGWVKPSLIKVQQATWMSAFAAYQFNSHWSARVNVSNLLDKQYPMGLQSGLTVDPAPPRTFVGTVSFSF